MRQEALSAASSDTKWHPLLPGAVTSPTSWRGAHAEGQAGAMQSSVLAVGSDQLKRCIGTPLVHAHSLVLDNVVVARQCEQLLPAVVLLSLLRRSQRHWAAVHHATLWQCPRCAAPPAAPSYALPPP